MRIIGGRNKGRTLILPDDKITRPTTDRVREALFNILDHHPDFNLQGSRILDAFAGSGSLGLEALSRGAGHVTFVESHPKIVPVLRQNIETVAGESHLLTHPIEKISQTSTPVDLVFLDPPYRQDLEVPTLQLLIDKGWIGSETLICLEMHARDPVPDVPWLEIRDNRTYGQVKIIFGGILR